MAGKHFLIWVIIACLAVVVFAGIKTGIEKWRASTIGQSASLGGGSYTDKYGNFAARSINDFYDGLRAKRKTISDPGSKTGVKYIYGFEDVSGRMAIDYKFDYVAFFSEGLAAVNLNDKWGYVDKKGEFVIPPSFEGGGDFSEGLAAVRLNDKWGYVDKKGEFVIQPQYFYAYAFLNGVATVRIRQDDDKAVRIDKTGRVISPDSSSLQSSW